MLQMGQKESQVGVGLTIEPADPSEGNSIHFDLVVSRYIRSSCDVNLAVESSLFRQESEQGLSSAEEQSHAQEYASAVQVRGLSHLHDNQATTYCFMTLP